MTEAHWSKEYLDRAEALLTAAYRENEALLAKLQVAREALEGISHGHCDICMAGAAEQALTAMDKP